jgi:hemin uptake protein HemP
MMADLKLKPPPTAAAAPPRAGTDTLVRSACRRTTVCITSDELFAGSAEVHIEHRGALYRLQQTSLGKLILTK